jgi:hypothetical protein
MYIQRTTPRILDSDGRVVSQSGQSRVRSSPRTPDLANATFDAALHPPERKREGTQNERRRVHPCSGRRGAARSSTDTGEPRPEVAAGARLVVATTTAVLLATAGGARRSVGAVASRGTARGLGGSGADGLLVRRRHNLCGGACQSLLRVHRRWIAPEGRWSHSRRYSMPSLVSVYCELVRVWSYEKRDVGSRSSTSTRTAS